MDFVAIDFETANHTRSSACSIGLAVVKDNKIVETRSYYIRPVPNYYASMNTRIHGITSMQTDSAPTFIELWENGLKDYFIGWDMVAHNAPFEKSVLNALSEVYEIDIPVDRMYCSLKMSRQRLESVNYQLDTVCNLLGIKFDNHHDALADAVACAEIVLALAEENGIDCLGQMYMDAPRKQETRSNNLLFRDCSQKADDYAVDEDMVKGKSFCFTGKLSSIQRDIAKVIIEKAGGTVKNSISSKVDYLVVGDLSAFGEDYQSDKIRKVRDYREKGSRIEILTEQQFQEFVVYEGPKITREMVETNSRDFLKANRTNALYGKGVCLSEGFDAEFMCRLSLLGVIMAPTHYDEDAYLTDYYIMSASVQKELFENGVKSPSVLRMESAMKKQLDPADDSVAVHHLKCLSEEALLEFLERRAMYEQEVSQGLEPKSMIIR